MASTVTMSLSIHYSLKPSAQWSPQRSGALVAQAFDGISDMPALTTLILAHNRGSSFQGLQSLDLLQAGPRQVFA